MVSMQKSFKYCMQNRFNHNANLPVSAKSISVYAQSPAIFYTPDFEMQKFVLLGQNQVWIY